MCPLCFLLFLSSAMRVIYPHTREPLQAVHSSPSAHAPALPLPSKPCITPPPWRYVQPCCPSRPKFITGLSTGGAVVTPYLVPFFLGACNVVFEPLQGNPRFHRKFILDSSWAILESTYLYSDATADSMCLLYSCRQCEVTVVLAVLPFPSASVPLCDCTVLHWFPFALPHSHTMATTASCSSSIFESIGFIKRTPTN